MKFIKDSVSAYKLGKLLLNITPEKQAKILSILVGKDPIEAEIDALDYENSALLKLLNSKR